MKTEIPHIRNAAKKNPSRWVRERKADMAKVSIDMEHVAEMKSAKI